MMPSAARETLLAQHARLRVLFGEALALACRREADGEGGAALEELIPRIRPFGAQQSRLCHCLTGPRIPNPRLWKAWKIFHEFRRRFTEQGE